MNTSDLPPAARQLAEIAERILCVEILETRHPDRLDFLRYGSLVHQGSA
ncbi:DUF6900 domain-containing protein [Paraburkholderia xenovorans]